MKKFLLFFVALGLSASLSAQITISPNFGANISTLHVTDIKGNINPALRYFGGVQVKNDISTKFSTGIGLQFTVKGYNADGTDTGTITSARLKYLDIAPFIEYRPISRLGLVAGTSIGYNLKEDYSIVGARDRPILTLNKHFDIAAFLGARYYFKQCFMSLQFSNSLTSISNVRYTDENGNKIKNASVLNQNLLLGFGYNFHLKKK